MNEKKKVKPAKQATRQYIKLWADLTDSPVPRNTPQRAMAVVWAVMSELNRHGGKDNGLLIVPYSTLERWVGTSNRNSIALGIRQAVELGLIAVIPGHVRKDGKKAPNRFRITWLPAHDGTPPTDEWKAILSDEHAKAILDKLNPHLKSERFNAAELAGKLGIRAKWGDTKIRSTRKQTKSSVQAGNTENERSVQAGNTDVGTGGVYRDENSKQSVGTGGAYYYLDKILPFVEPSPEVVPNGEAKSSHPHVADAVRNHPAKSEIPEPPVSVWQKNDAAWFKANPERTHRIRRPLVGEFDDLFPDPDAVYVVVRQDAPGRRIRRPAIWQEDTLLGDDESLAHAIFDLVSETDGEPFTREQLAARIHEYRKPGVA